MHVYMDNAATTKVSENVLRAMTPYFDEIYGNPSSAHGYGRKARHAVDLARGNIGKSLSASANEIYFTAGGTEADNWALIGAALANQEKGKHIVTTKIEHHAVLHTAQYLESQGFSVTYLPVDENGRVSADELRSTITDQTTLVSVMMANNEIGTVQPIAEIGAICKERGIFFHTDAVQAFMQVPINVNDMHIDMLSLSGHKIHAPKGIGTLYIRKGTRIDNLLHGGAQEKGSRAGTENVPGIVGFSAATEAALTMPERIERIGALRDRLMDGLLAAIPDIVINGDRENRLPNNCHISIRGIKGEGLLTLLDIKGIAASSGSACTAGSIEPSHVLKAIGQSDDLARGSLRLTLSSMNTDEEVDYVLSELPLIVKRLRG